MKYIRAILFVVLVMCLAGCSTWGSTTKYVKDSWETTKDYIDPPPQIDTDSYQFSNPNQEKLARLFTPVDGPLTSLARFVDNTDTIPDLDWMDLLLARFPWAHRVLVTDEEGTIIFMQPEVPVKKIEKPLVFEGVWRDITLLTVVDYSDLGPEVYVGRPYFRDVEFQGLIAVGFDPRTLLGLSPSPEELIIIHPGGGVWSRGADVDEAALLAQPWESMLKERVEGQIEAGGKHYTWLVRYIGDSSYVYATESVDPKANEESWWFF